MNYTALPYRSPEYIAETEAYMARCLAAETAKVSREIMNQYVCGDYMYSVFYEGSWVWPGFNPDDDRFYDEYWQCYVQVVDPTVDPDDPLSIERPLEEGCFATEREALKFVRDHIVKQLNLKFEAK